MTKTKLLILTILATTLFWGCVDKKKPIKVGYLPIAECLPLYVAKEKGYFEKYGLNIELVSVSGGPEIFRELEAGAIDIGFSNVVTLIKQANVGKSYQSIFGASYETISNTNHAIFGRSNENIPLDKAIFGVNAHKNIEELMLLNYLHSNGIEINSKTIERIKETPFPQMLSSLRDKEIDYACIVEPGITNAKNDTVNYKFIGNHYPVNDTSRVLVATYVATTKVISEKSEEITNFIKAMKEATEYINQGNTDVRKCILNYTKLPESLLNKISLPEFTNSIDEKELNKVIELMYSSTINIDNSFITNPTQKVKYNDVVLKQK